MNILFGLLKGLVLGILAGALAGAGCSMIFLAETSRQPVYVLGLYIYGLWGAFVGTFVGSITGMIYGTLRPLIPWTPSAGGRALEGACIGALIGLGLLAKIEDSPLICYLPTPIAGALFGLAWGWRYRAAA